MGRNISAVLLLALFVLVFVMCGEVVSASKPRGSKGANKSHGAKSRTPKPRTNQRRGKKPASGNKQQQKNTGEDVSAEPSTPAPSDIEPLFTEAKSHLEELKVHLDTYNELINNAPDGERKNKLMESYQIVSAEQADLVSALDKLQQDYQEALKQMNEQPSQPEQPSTPEQPTQPEQPPVTPEQPSTPEEPEQPVDPSTPEEPEQPTQPEVPSTPEEPVQPEPTSPEEPTQPEQPSTPEEPAQPEQPEPVDPSTPQEAEPTPQAPAVPEEPSETPSEQPTETPAEQPETPQEPTPAPEAPSHGKPTLYQKCKALFKELNKKKHSKKPHHSKHHKKPRHSRK